MWFLKTERKILFTDYQTFYEGYQKNNFKMLFEH